MIKCYSCINCKLNTINNAYVKLDEISGTDIQFRCEEKNILLNGISNIDIDECNKYRQMDVEFVDKMIGDKGFMFIDDSDKPFKIWQIQGEPWLYYWNEGNKKWVSLKAIGYNEVVIFEKLKIDDKFRKLYDDYHESGISIIDNIKREYSQYGVIDVIENDDEKDRDMDNFIDFSTVSINRDVMDLILIVLDRYYNGEVVNDDIKGSIECIKRSLQVFGVIEKDVDKEDTFINNEKTKYEVIENEDVNINKEVLKLVLSVFNSYREGKHFEGDVVLNVETVERCIGVLGIKYWE